MIKNIGIRLGKKDGDLKSWFLAIKEKNLEQSFYIKKALESYIAKKNIQLGKVHYKEYDEPYTTSYTVSLQDTEILLLVETLEKNNIKVSSFLKNILRNSISIIPLSEEEYIPNYFNMYDIQNMPLFDESINQKCNHSLENETTELTPDCKPKNDLNPILSDRSISLNENKPLFDESINQNENKNNNDNNAHTSADKSQFALRFVHMGKGK